MASTGHALEMSLIVMVMAAVAVTLSVVSISIGWYLGRDTYLFGKRQTRRWLRSLNAWTRYRLTRFKLRHSLTTEYFEPWADDEKRRRHERS